MRCTCSCRKGATAADLRALGDGAGRRGRSNRTRSRPAWERSRPRPIAPKRPRTRSMRQWRPRGELSASRNRTPSMLPGSPASSSVVCSASPGRRSKRPSRRRRRRSAMSQSSAMSAGLEHRRHDPGDSSRNWASPRRDQSRSPRSRHRTAGAPKPSSGSTMRLSPALRELGPAAEQTESAPGRP